MSVLMAMMAVAAGMPVQGSVQGPATATATATEQASEKKICRRTKTTGSRLREPKQCNTAVEWKRIDAAARDDVNNARTRARPAG